MPPKKKGNNVTRRFAPKKLPIEYAEPGQLYAVVETVHGNCHFTVITTTNDKKVASLTGAVKKNGRVKTQDLVLIEPIGENENGKYQIIFKYTPIQRKILEQEGKLIFSIPAPQQIITGQPVPPPIDDNVDFEEKEDIKKKVQASEDNLINALFIDDI
jgi:initiation factor 1A